MNQIPASILILTSSILAYAATTGTSSFVRTDAALANQTPVVQFILALASMALGIWGVISLVQSSIRERELMFDSQPRHDVLGMFDPRRMGRPYGTPMGNPVQRTADPAGVTLTPEMKAQLSMAAHLEGRDRSAIIEEALRRYLPRYENSKAA